MLLVYKLSMMTQTGHGLAILRIYLPNIFLFTILCDIIYLLVIRKSASDLWLSFFMVVALTWRPHHVFYLALAFVYLRSLYILLQDNISESAMTIISLTSILCSRHLYFLSDHRMEFNSLQLSVGFIGRDHFDFLHAGILLAINTFAVDIVLFLYTYYAFFIDEDDDPRIYPRLWLCCQQGLVSTSMLSTFILRRHLMVWAIFAPKLVFETCFFAIRIFMIFVLAWFIN